MKLFLMMLFFSVTANATYNCEPTDFGRQAEQTYQCTSKTGGYVCLRIESSFSGQRRIQIKNESDSYSQFFQETNAGDACKTPDKGSIKHCRLSKVYIETNSIVATTSSLDFEFNSIHRAALLFDKSTLQGKFNLLSRSEFQNDWVINDSFNNCKLVK